MPSDREFESFWDFSVRTYRTSGVPVACLAMQNDYGVDVNMLLYCCWIGACIGRFDDETFKSASEFSAIWADHVVTPLRTTRTWMKHTGCASDPLPTNACMELRESIKTVEFAAEKLQQEVLESLVSAENFRDVQTDQVLADVDWNLRHYCTDAGLDVHDDIRQNFSVIINAAFPPSV